MPAALPGLATLAAGIGDPHVRNRGTIGGSVANNDPAADYPAAVLALGATIATNKREIAADQFFTGLFSTALEDDEIITAISFPMPAKFAYAKFANPASRYALVGVAVAQRGADARVAVTGAGQSGVFRVRRQGGPGRIELRHPCRRRVPGPSDRRHDEAGASGSLSAHRHRRPRTRPSCAAVVINAARPTP